MRRFKSSEDVVVLNYFCISLTCFEIFDDLLERYPPSHDLLDLVALIVHHELLDAQFAFLVFPQDVSNVVAHVFYLMFVPSFT